MMPIGRGSYTNAGRLAYHSGIALSRPHFGHIRVLSAPPVLLLVPLMILLALLLVLPIIVLVFVCLRILLKRTRF